jgi:glycine oxidase
MNSELKKIEYLIVGQGLAGTLLAHFLLKQNKNVLVIDDEREMTSSKIAAGMFNPISGKRMVKSKQMNTLLPFALQTYRELEELLHIHVLHQQSIYNVFGSVKEGNDLSLRLDDTDFTQHINLNPAPQQHIKQPFGSFEINGSGWVNTKLLLQKFKDRLIEQHQFYSDTFDYALLKQEDNKWLYKDYIADYIIFCEGAKGIHNPFFTNLDFQLCKGDILTIECKGLSKDRILKKGIYLVHLHDDVYKVGSTYEWNDLSETPTPSGLQTMIKKLDELIDVPYKILSHEAAIRPTTRTRETIAIQHPERKKLFMLNGLGTKGVLNGPWYVAQLLKNIL